MYCREELIRMIRDEKIREEEAGNSIIKALAFIYLYR